jgi:Ca-activated chloride channel family protein
MARFPAVLISALVAGATVAGAQQGATFRTGTNAVSVYATVVDRSGRLVSDLTAADFEVFDNGRRQELTVFSNALQPITAVLLVDTSASMAPTLHLARQAAEQFVIRMLPEDKAKVGAFNDKIETHPSTFTDNRDQLIRLLKDELDFGYPTRLYDAVDFGIEELREVTGRKVVLVFTDGEDTSSRLGSGDVLDRARAEEVMVYSIGLENEYFDGQQRRRTSPDRGLRKLSEETGGGFFVLKKKDELGATFTRVAQELHSQYVLGFTPETLDGKVHKLEVRVKRPGTTARARKSYIAASATPPQGGK